MVAFLAIFATGCSGGPPPPPPPPCCDPEPVDTAAEVPHLCEPGTVCTVAGLGVPMLNGLEGEPLEVGLFWPSSVLYDPGGRLVVVDYNNNLVRRIDDDGVMRAIVGNGGHSYAIDGVLASETGMENPTDAVYDAAGNLYLVESHGSRILRIDPEGWLTVHVGDPIEPGYERCDGDGGPARDAGLSNGWGVAHGDDGTLWFTEPNTDVIRRVSAAGIVDTIAGLCDPTLYHLNCGLVDGIGAEARFCRPSGIEFHDGMLYVADSGNHAIRRIDPVTLEVTTVAGVGSPGLSGDGGSALEAAFTAPNAVSFDGVGAMYIADSGNNVLRRIDPDGTLTTVAGTGEAGFGGDGLDPLSAMFHLPWDVHVLPNGDVVVVDSFNARVRGIGALAAPRATE